ncbi:MAG TPA: transferrin receptor-like dimerization domain-containing protein [Cyclobacteriaceae bacterium]|nr:transferrin receptor-like dimerization domain-containing protein [Cyclobacteriaceae bacterium]
MKNLLVLLLILITNLGFSQKSILGFTEEGAKAELALEEKFDSYLKTSNIDQWMKHLTGRPHHLGSAMGKEYAMWMRDQFRSWGYEAEVETYKVLFPTPKVRVLEMVGPTRFKAKLVEPALKEDATSGQLKEQLPTYHGFSADGDVTAELVFVGYGVPSDYDELEKLGIDVKGKIVIAKYGGSWRGIKPKVAQEKGAIGCIIYSDPEDDGYFQGDVYPKGPFRPGLGAQRGSVLDLPVRPGDPLTPNIGATEEAKRIERAQADNLISIPVLPIGYDDAEPLLKALGGPVAPEYMRGSMPLTYHVGPGPARVHLNLAFDWKLVDCHNVIAKMKGAELPNEWVIRGNHHDAWVNGASDPISGMVALMEEARAVSELVKTGWKPKRTIIYCGWDGEEPGLIGSTEWAEHHAQELQQKTVAYINSDGNGRGFLYAQGSHTLEQLVSDVARDVTDPQTGVSILERRKSALAANTSSTKAKKEIINSPSMTISALGSGSDYTPFIQHLGIPALNIGFGGENEGGEYHSIYDSYDHFKRFKDPKFEYGVALAKTAGRTTLRLVNATVLPFDFKGFHKTVSGYVNEVTGLLSDMRESTEVENQMIKENRYKLASDPTKTFVQPKANDPVPYLNFSNLQNAVASLETSAKTYAELLKANPNPNTNLEKLNKTLYQAEQTLMIDAGLPRRPWFRHSIYAPGYYTGYGVKTLPGIREAIEQRNWKEAQEQIEIVAKNLNNYTKQIDAAAAVLKMR